MKIEVVNVRDFPFERPTPYIYVGRYMPGLFSGHPLGNPFKVPKRAKLPQRMDVLATYREWLATLPERDALLSGLALALAKSGKPLGCWCHPKPCHADVLAELLQPIVDELLLGNFK